MDKIPLSVKEKTAMSVNLKYRTKLKNFGDKNANFERVYKNFRTEKLLLLCSDTTVKKEKVLLQSEENKISTDNAKEVLKKIEEWGVLKENKSWRLLDSKKLLSDARQQICTYANSVISNSKNTEYPFKKDIGNGRWLICWKTVDDKYLEFEVFSKPSVFKNYTYFEVLGVRFIDEAKFKSDYENQEKLSQVVATVLDTTGLSSVVAKGLNPEESKMEMEMKQTYWYLPTPENKVEGRTLFEDRGVYCYVLATIVPSSDAIELDLKYNNEDASYEEVTKFRKIPLHSDDNDVVDEDSKEADDKGTTEKDKEAETLEKLWLECFLSLPDSELVPDPDSEEKYFCKMEDIPFKILLENGTAEYGLYHIIIRHFDALWSLVKNLEDDERRIGDKLFNTNQIILGKKEIPNTDEARKTIEEYRTDMKTIKDTNLITNLMKKLANCLGKIMSTGKTGECMVKKWTYKSSYDEKHIFGWELKHGDLTKYLMAVLPNHSSVDLKNGFEVRRLTTMYFLKEKSEYDKKFADLRYFYDADHGKIRILNYMDFKEKMKPEFNKSEKAYREDRMKKFQATFQASEEEKSPDEKKKLDDEFQKQSNIDDDKRLKEYTIEKLTKEPKLANPLITSVNIVANRNAECFGFGFLARELSRFVAIVRQSLRRRRLATRDTNDRHEIAFFEKIIHCHFRSDDLLMPRFQLEENKYETFEGSDIGVVNYIRDELVKQIESKSQAQAPENPSKYQCIEFDGLEANQETREKLFEIASAQKKHFINKEPKNISSIYNGTIFNLDYHRVYESHVFMTIKENQLNGTEHQNKIVRTLTTWKFETFIIS